MRTRSDGKYPQLEKRHSAVPGTIRPRSWPEVKEGEPYVMMPRKNSTSSRTRMRMIVSSRKWPREMAICSTAKR